MNRYDSLAKIEQRITRIHEHGYVELLDCMPRLVETGETIENRITDAARCSTSLTKKTSTKNADRMLIRRLMRDGHTSPFEQVELTFAIQLPIFVMRQLVRHRTAHLNEFSGRYSTMPDLFYFPSELRAQHQANKQMSGEPISDPDIIARFNTYIADTGYEQYSQLCEAGVARELARIGLPVNIYTRIYWKIDLHNFLNFSRLRLAEDAQLEIREYAAAMYAFVKQLCPWSCTAFEDYRINAITFSACEIRALKSGDESKLSASEKAEFAKKKELILSASENAF